MRRFNGVNKDMRLVLSNIVPSRAVATALLCTFGSALSVTAAPAVSKPACKTVCQACKPASKTPSQQLGITLLKALNAQSALSGHRVSVGTSGGNKTVFLNGFVADVSQRGLAEKTVRRLVPNAKIVNSVQVQSRVAAAKPVAKPGPKPTTSPAAKPASQPMKPVVAVPNAAGVTVQEEKIAGTLVKFKMVKVPAGKVMLPNPKDAGALHEVAVKSFWIGQKEVAWDEFDVFMFKLDLSDEEGAKIDGKTRPSLPYGAPDRGFGHEGFPAISLSRHSAEMYCAWLSKKTGKKYRLPTEAEWEYAALAGNAPVKMSLDELKKVGWIKENAEEKTHSVGAKAPNAWGLYDTLGNAGEWVTGYDGEGVLKGGSFAAPAEKVNNAWRAKQEISWHDPNKPKSKWWLADGPFAGFRIVRED